MSAETANFIAITPESSHIVTQDVVVVCPFPHGGDALNSNDRYQWVADELRITILAVDLFAQKRRTLYGQPVHQALEAGEHFKRTSQRNAEQVRDQLARYPSARVIGLGQSLAGVAITGMQRYAESPFDAVQVDDGFNLRPTGKPSVAGFLTYLVKDTLQQKWSESRGRDVVGRQLLTRHDWSAYEEPTRKSALANIHDLSGLMRSNESRQDVEALAADPEQRLHLVSFTRGISGSLLEVSTFILDLKDARRAGVYKLMAQDPDHATPMAQAMRRLIADQPQPGWHSKTLHPAVLARNLEATIDLTTLA